MNEEVKRKFDSYPQRAKLKLLELRELIFEVSAELEEIGEIEETLKWGEPSYLSKVGSAVRIDWKGIKPNQYAMYFHCQTKLVDTFRELYRETLQFEGNRAIVFSFDEKVPRDELKHCISLSLRYHKIKSLPLLGA